MFNRKEYQRNWQQKNKLHLCEYQRKWRKMNRNKSLISERKYLRAHPWMKHLKALRKRCNAPYSDHYQAYGKRGIKALITANEIKQLYFTYKAYLMVYPSIDRINNDGDYSLENCRFIEYNENTKQSRRNS